MEGIKIYNKLFTKILDSSIWLEPTTTRIVWLTLIAGMDEDGFVALASVANLAHRARVERNEAEEAVKILESPDPDSSDPDHEGRRIERVTGGWMVLNGPKYRDLVTRTVSREQTRARVARHRAKKASNAQVTAEKRECNGDVTQSDAGTHSETKAEVPPKAPAVVGGDVFPDSEFSTRISKLYGRKPSTKWNEKEIKAFKALVRREAITHEGLDLIEGYYAMERAKGKQGNHRRDLGTFLNNFDGELDRATNAMPPEPPESAWFVPSGPANSESRRQAILDVLRADKDDPDAAAILASISEGEQ